MATFPFTYRQRVPVTGYRWRDFVAEGLVKTGEPILVWDEKSPHKEYNPLTDEPTLFLRLAETETEPNAILSFANRYGNLGLELEQDWTRLFDYLQEGHIRQELEDENFIESLPAWQRAIRWLAYFVRLWRFARAEDARSLRRLFSWVDAEIVINDPPKRLHRMAGDATGYFRKAAKELGILSGDVLGAAKFYLHCALNHGGLDGTYLWLEWDKANKKSHLSFAVRSLWGAIILQFTEAVIGHRDYQRCVGCARWFELAPGVNRADRLTCSDSCRQRHYRHRKEMAIELHSQGKNLRQIAKEIGSDVETIKGWLARRKGK